MRNFTLTKAACIRISFTAILVISLFTPGISQVRMRANLMIVDANGATLMDGNMTNYDANYSNAVDGYDIWKMSNFGENFGIVRSAANLVIERRNLIGVTDTTYFRMWNVQQRNYRLQLIVENLHTFNLMAFVRDNFLNQDIPVSLNDTSDIDFAVTSDLASRAQNRFTLIYRNINSSGAVLPVHFTSIHAQRKNNDILVSWQVENETNVVKYVVEYSIDALRFTSLRELAGSNSSVAKTYSTIDTRSTTADHFYRVRGVDLAGKIQYSAIARLGAANAVEALNIYPNPVPDKKAHLQLNVTNAGNYRVCLTAINGQRTKLGSLSVSSGQSFQTLILPKNIAPGVYRLQLTAPDNTFLLKTIHVL